MRSYRTPSRSHAPRAVRCALAAIALASLAACSPFNKHRQSLDTLHAGGAYDVALDRLNDPDVKDLYGAKNRILYRLDRGAILLALNQPDNAFEELNTAERLIEAKREENPGESLAAILINDNLAPYIAEPYEDIYINVLKMAAQLERGRVSGGATVEARRMALKANLLRDEYLEALPEARSEVEGRAARVPPTSVRTIADFTSGGEFIESPLGVFLSALAFMQEGTPNDQQVAARRLQQIISAQGELIGDVDPEPFEDLADLRRGDVQALVVAFSGRGPTKTPLRIGPIIIDRVSVYFELPILQWTPSEVDDARIVVRPAAPDGDEPSEIAAELHLVENLARVADANHRRALPLIYFRTLVRAAAKSYGLYEANKAVDNATDNDFARIGVRLGGLLLLGLTEAADIRSWSFLPGQAHVGLLDLAPGEYEARVEYLAGAGAVVYATQWQPMTIQQNQLTSIVTHYWR